MEAKNYSQYWCNTMIEYLINLGIEYFFLAPGSRSTPLVSAIARNKRAQIMWAIDERSLAFLALGYAKTAQKTAVIVVTSGTAVANLYPAVVEAYLSFVPLLILSADRPYELRDSGANQTIFQAGIFSSHIKKSFDLAPPSSQVSIEQSLAIFRQAFLHCQLAQKGPVHINIQLREPLANLRAEKELSWQPESIDFMPPPCEIQLELDTSAVLQRIKGKRGFFFVGELLASSLQEKILCLAEQLGWPIIADVISNLRFKISNNILHYADLALMNPDFFRDVDYIIYLGGRIVSKRFWEALEKTKNIKIISLNDNYERLDPSGLIEEIFVPNLAAAIESLVKALKDNRPQIMLSAQRERAKNMGSLVNNFLENKENNEAYYTSRLIAQITEPVNLFVSSSMPIRDLNQFAPASSVPINCYANRGASGIDGIISSAVGMALAEEKLNILLIGDVAFLHDQGALSLINRLKSPLLIILINNNGGGIFQFLPVAKEADVLTPYIDTPHQTDFALLCKAHAVQHYLVTNSKSYDSELRRFFEEKSSRVIEVVINKFENVKLHKEFYNFIAI